MSTVNSIEVSMELNEILLYLELIKPRKKRLSVTEMNLFLYLLNGYEEVKVFYNKFVESGLKMPKNYEVDIFIYFIEDLEDTYKLKEVIIKNYDRRKKYYYKGLFFHQLNLCTTKELASRIVDEALEYDIDLRDIYLEKYNSLKQIKLAIEEWKSDRETYDLPYFPNLYAEFCKLRDSYFNQMSLRDLVDRTNSTDDSGDKRKANITYYTRSLLIKEFAKRVAKGNCQLCGQGAPFIDKQGNPFLEVHHIQFLSKGGSDTLDNVVALCPNCHRKMHHIGLDEDVKNLKDKALLHLKNI